MSAASLRARYLGDSVATASPQQVLVMLYDRLTLDLERAQLAVAEGDRARANEELQHAQSIVLELLSSLQVSGSAAAGSGNSPYTPAGRPNASGSATSGGRGDRHPPADWREALTQLEGDVLDAQESLARGRAEEIAAWGRRSSDWVPPSGLGPIPPDLRERAARLLQHQLAVAELLVERITQSQKQRDVAARMSFGAARPVPSFIDRAL